MRRLILGLITALALLVPAAPLLPATAPTAAALSQAGRFTMAGLGAAGRTTLNVTVYNWGCRGGLIGTHAYQWDCAGANNRYLIGHAYAAFAPLYKFIAARGASVGTRALVGRVATWTSVTGVKTRFKVAWAKVVSVGYWGRTGADWAWNGRPAPSITLQTCYGSRSQYRILVRLVRIAA